MRVGIENDLESGMMPSGVAETGMGDREAGKAIVAAAEAWWRAHDDPSSIGRHEAVEALGAIAAGFTDPSFEGAYFTDTALTRLITAAFEPTPEELEDFLNGDGDIWNDGPVARFYLFLAGLAATQRMPS